MRRRRPHHHGFTLLELTIVLLIIAFAAAMIIPRLNSTSRRSFETTVDQLSDLLLMYAQRENLSQRPVGLRRIHDDNRDWLLLEVLEVDPRDPTIETWRRDRFVQPVKLPSIIDSRFVVIRADGEPVDIEALPLSNTPGETRPHIDITIQTVDQSMSATLSLAPHALAPMRIGVDDDRLQVRTPLDLDQYGLGREDW